MAEEEDGVEVFLKRRFPGQEQLIQTWVAKLANEGFVSLTLLKEASFQQVRELGLPLAFAIRLEGEGYLSQQPLPRRRARRTRTFLSSDAIDLDKHYYCPWPDFDALLTDVLDGKWLLLTGPWQSGKTSLLNALGLALEERGYLVLLTTLDDLMVKLGSNRKKDEVSAASNFYIRLATKLCDAARSELERPAGRVESVVDLFKVPKGGAKLKDVIWLVDEAQLLNRINHQTGYAVHNLLSSLREAKRESASKNKLGTYRLHSFCLCGLPELSALIGNVRNMEAIDRQACSSPQNVFDPLRPHLSGWSSPLSKQVHRDVWRLDEEQITAMIRDYAADRNFLFKMDEGEAVSLERHEEAVSAISKDIFERTSGHVGLVGSCCTFLQSLDREAGAVVRSFEQWLKRAKGEALRTHVFNGTVYSKMVGVVAGYPDRVKSVILACIDSGDGSADIDSVDTVLEAIVDGVLQVCGTLRVCFTSPLLLSALLESCKFAPLQVAPASTDSLLEVFETAISFMNPHVFMRPKVLNSTGQPSEYVMQSQLFRSLMFVMEQGIYTLHRYNVFVDVKKRDENGVRTQRMDGYMENAGAPKQGLEIEVGNGKSASVTRKTVEDHLERSVYYKRLHGCEMHYMYFWVGDGDGDGNAKGVMEELQNEKSFPGVTCWYVNFMPGERVWRIERLKDDGNWATTRKNVAPVFPMFLLSSLEARKRGKF